MKAGESRDPALHGEFTRLMARDGHEFDAWLSPPKGNPRGAVLVLQEIFGVNSHIRAVADSFSAEGYVAIAPSLFDRARRNVQMGYTAQDVELGRGYVAQVPEEKLILDMAASINVVRHAGPVGVVGYCWGGSLAYLAACKLPVSAAVSYYGSRTVHYLDHKPQAPVMYHFGDRDKTLLPEAIEKIRAAHPQGQYFIYAADHGFNCDQRASFDASAAKLARERTVKFFAEHLGGAQNAATATLKDKWDDA